MASATDSLRASQRLKTAKTSRIVKKKKSQVMADVQQFTQIEDSSLNGIKQLENTMLNNFTSPKQNDLN